MNKKDEIPKTHYTQSAKTPVMWPSRENQRKPKEKKKKKKPTPKSPKTPVKKKGKYKQTLITCLKNSHLAIVGRCQSPREWKSEEDKTKTNYRVKWVAFGCTKSQQGRNEWVCKQSWKGFLTRLNRNLRKSTIQWQIAGHLFLVDLFDGSSPFVFSYKLPSFISLFLSLKFLGFP